MLETPKADATGLNYPVKKRQDGTMDNQQATLIAACFYVCEGHFTLRKSKNGRGGIQYHCEIGFTNSEAELIDFIGSWLEANEIRFAIRQCTGTKRPCYQVYIQNKATIIRLIELIEPYMLGQKKAQARIVHAFLVRRLSRANSSPVRKGHKGWDNDLRKYDEEDEALWTEKQLLRESSEATRTPRYWPSHRTMREYLHHRLRVH